MPVKGKRGEGTVKDRIGTQPLQSLTPVLGTEIHYIRKTELVRDTAGGFMLLCVKVNFTQVRVNNP